VRFDPDSAIPFGDVLLVSGCVDEDGVLSFARGELPDEALVALHAHLDRCASCNAAAAEALSSPAATRQMPPALTSSTFAAGTLLLDRYRVVRYLARGGMGEVYEVEDVERGAGLAIKAISLELSDQPAALARLRAEVRLAGRIVHPNVCRVFDLHGFAGGAFVTMELLAGQTLGARLREQGRLDPHEILPLVQQLAAGLTAAHDANVIHRDFKSDNVMLCAGPEVSRPRAVILDFGLARSTIAEPGLSSITSASAVIGTIGYIAPEQVEGQRGASPALDVYALGVVIFEMCTGRLPFRGDTPLATALERLSRPAPAPSSLAAGLPAVFDRVVARCLQRDPARRFATVREVAEAMTF
jgi:serine/threonine protein kinase